MRAPFGVAALALIASISAANAQQSIKLSLGFATPPYHTTAPFRTVQIGNPKILDVRALTDQSVAFQPLARGSTNVLFMDDNGRVVDDLLVDISGIPPATLQIMKPGTAGQGMASMLYRCGDKQGCEFVGFGDIHVGVPPEPPPTTVIQSETHIQSAQPQFQAR